MPHTLTRTFRIRSYECDANGHLNSANYLRFMQETAFDASSAAGYGPDRYDELKHIWLIRETDIEFLHPLSYNDQVEVKTWVADFRRVSSRRAYEFRRQGDPQPCAQAYSDWVYLDVTNNWPASIPAELIRAFYPEGLPEKFAPRQPFHKAPPPPVGAYVTHRRVQWHDIDNLQHVNNAIYLTYCAECIMQVMESLGWSWQRLQALGRASYLRRFQIQYLQPARLEDELEITTWSWNVQNSHLWRRFAIRRAGDQTLLAQVNWVSVWIDLASGRPTQFPEQFLDDLAPNISPGEQTTPDEADLRQASAA